MVVVKGLTVFKKRLITYSIITIPSTETNIANEFASHPATLKRVPNNIKITET